MIKNLSTLKKRILTAAILAPAVLGITIFGSIQSFTYMLLVFLVIAAYEWTSLSAIKKPLRKLIFIVLILALFIYFSQIFSPEHLLALAIVSWLWWTIVLFLLNRVEDKQSLGALHSRFNNVIKGVFTLVPAFIAIKYLHEYYGVTMVLFLFAIIWGADIGAYFTGKRFGVSKLAPILSPGKTVEGVAGGLFFVALIAALFGFYSDLSLLDICLLIALSLVIAIFSVVGDLFESLLKRRAGLKDSSQILPGHGGVLDRIDSLLAAAPLFLTAYHFGIAS